MTKGVDYDKKVKIKGTFRAVDMTMNKKPSWNSVSTKMHYMVAWHSGDGRFRVFAQAKVPIRHRQWEQLFEKHGGLELKRIPGLFEDWDAYKRRLSSQPHNIVVEHGPRPVRLARMTELEEAKDKIRVLEDENCALRAELQRMYKRKASEMCAEEDDEAEAEEDAEAEAEEHYEAEVVDTEVKCVTLVAREGTEMLDWRAQQPGEAGYHAWVENGLRERLVYLAWQYHCRRGGKTNRAVAVAGDVLKLSEWRSLFEFANVTVEPAEWSDVKAVRAHYDRLESNGERVTELFGSALV